MITCLLINQSHRNNLFRRCIKHQFSKSTNLKKPRQRAKSNYDASNQHDLLDLDIGQPHLWYNEARSISRSVICHVGPTNSGKTFQALSKLISAKSGIYCGPLRLLAWEVCEKIRSYDVNCNLITGNEKDVVDNATHMACTVEMPDLYKYYDVAVIDEAQLIGDNSRGWAWTHAILGLQVKELHLCGSPSMIHIIKMICEYTGDKLIIKEYDRLLPLSQSDRPLMHYKHVRPGDAVVGFSRKSLYKIKEAIENANPMNKSCVIYGSLPPKARQDQAKLFSDPESEYNCLVATDAVGMGLNLAIRRIIFATMKKYDGRRRRKLFPSEVKQIAGRAGRYQSLYKEGEVTCLKCEDMAHLRHCMSVDDKVIKKAGLHPSLEQLKLLAIIMKYSITRNLLSEFWNDYFIREYGSVGVEESTYDHDQWQGLGTIVKQFETIERFEYAFQSYLHIHDKKNPAIRSTRDHRKKNSSSPSSYKGSTCDPISSYLDTMPSLLLVSKKDQPKLTKLQEPLFRGDDMNSHHNDHDANDHQLITSSAIDNTSLTYLLHHFREKVEFVKEGHYFLCNIDDMIAIAKIVDEYKDKLSLNLRFLLCKAPINPDDDSIVVEAFKRYVEEFCYDSKVTCHIYFDDDSVPPQTDEEFLECEAVHRVLDLYLWLSYRIPGYFDDVELARAQAVRCSTLINDGLAQTHMYYN